MKNIPTNITFDTIFSNNKYKAMLPQIKIGKHKLNHEIKEYVFLFFY